jgi:ABC-type Fe3+-hydroxamate transport system substrate-binding protein
MPDTEIGDPRLVDAMGTRHEAAAATARIVSLVPSITELLFDLELAGQIVGRTGFCTEPRDKVKKVAKVGGTKTIDVAKIKRLAPSHLVVNIDENPRPVIEDLARFVPHVIVTHPRGPADNLALYRLMGGIFNRQAQAEALCAAFSKVWDEVHVATRAWPRQRVLYLIWKSPWMTVSEDTYIARMLSAVGWDAWAPASPARYPSVDLTPENLARVDLVLLSSEPYSFSERHCAELLELMPQESRTRVALIDGAMTSWYGSRAIAGLKYLREFRANLG